jgi:hypothetical protein
MSEIKVNKISPRSGTTVTLGDSGDTFTIPSGATINNQGTATNFGATGAASWTTTVKTNSDSGFTATAGEGYFLNTTAGTISVNLPAGSAGAVVAFKDYAKTWDTNNVTLVQNGSDKIGGSTVNAILTTEGAAVTLVFIDSTQGWLVTDDGLQSTASTAQFVSASGGNSVATSGCGNFKLHTFTSPGTFTVCSAGNACGSNTIDYLVVAGGASGGRGRSGGGGAGGFRLSNGYGSPAPKMSPLASPTALPVTATGYPVTVGAGGAAQTSSAAGNNGSNSIFAGTTTITSAGGGGGGQDGTTGGDGGSGGGGGESSVSSNIGAGNTPPVSPSQGFPGGASDHAPPTGGPHPVSPAPYAGGGGGGASEQGNRGAPGGAGGAGSFIPSSDFGGSNGTTGPVSCAQYFSGGGAGIGCASSSPGASVSGGVGGGGTAPAPGTAGDGTANTGGGGSGFGNTGSGTTGAGGSGIVIIRYKFQ